MTEPARTWSSARHFASLSALLVVWFCGLSYLPPLVGTCFDGTCGFTPREVAISIAVPLAFFLLPIALEVVLFRKSLGRALSDLGLTRLNPRGLGVAALILVPLCSVFPVFSAATGAPLSLRPGWPLMVLGVMLNNGLAEETMMRGFVFRHLRRGRTFWRAAGLSTAFFAAYHLPILVVAGPAIGLGAVLLAVPTGYVTAWLYERGENTVWGPVLMHVVHNALVMVLMVGPERQQTATLVYLGVSISTGLVLVVALLRSEAKRGVTRP